MARREYLSRFQCGHPGCTEIDYYTSSTRADQAELYRKRANGQHRCVRHIAPDKVLSAEAPKRVTEEVCRQEAHGRYWKTSGFVYGPGFQAWAKDFPPGTILRITAEVILPDTPPSPEGASNG